MPSSKSLSFFKRGNKKAKDASVDQADPQASTLFSTAGDYGLQVISDPEIWNVDVIFVHGLTGNRQSTWTCDNDVFWPQDLLPGDLNTARIMTFGYDADIVGVLQTAGSNTLRDHGKNLANDLAMRRVRSDSRGHPLIFVAHSLEGLVVEQALLISRGAAQDHLKALLDSTRAIAFMGTPHMGSAKAEWAGVLTRLSSVVRTPNRSIVSVLEPGSEVLATLQQEFHTMLEGRSRNLGTRLEIYCFYEEVDVAGIGEIVPRHSAILPAYLNASIHGDHMSMTKFTGKTDPGYVRVCDVLWLWVTEIERLNTEERSNGSQGDRQRTNGPIYSGGGHVFMGSNNAGRDMTTTYLHRAGRE